MYHLSIINKKYIYQYLIFVYFTWLVKTFFLYMYILLKTRFPSVNNVKVETKIHLEQPFTLLTKTRPRGYKTWVHSQTQNEAQWLAACGHVPASSQPLRIILSLRINASFITSRPGSTVTVHLALRMLEKLKQSNPLNVVGIFSDLIIISFKKSFWMITCNRRCEKDPLCGKYMLLYFSLNL